MIRTPVPSKCHQRLALFWQWLGYIATARFGTFGKGIEPTACKRSKYQALPMLLFLLAAWGAHAIYGELRAVLNFLSLGTAPL